MGILAKHSITKEKQHTMFYIITTLVLMGLFIGCIAVLNVVKLFINKLLKK